MKIFKILLSFIFIILIAIVSQWIVTITNIKFPGSLLGMIILALLMYFKIVNIEFIELSGNLLLKYISLFFVPLLVGAVAYLFKMENSFLAIFVVFMITSTLLIIFTGLTVQYLLMRKICKEIKLKN